MKKTKSEILDEMKVYINGISENYHKNYTRTVCGALYAIKELGNLDNNDLSTLLGVPVYAIEKMLQYDWNGHISTKMLIKIYILSLGTLTVPGCKLDENEKGTIDNFYKQTISSSIPGELDVDESTDEEMEIDLGDVIMTILTSPKLKQILDNVKATTHEAQDKCKCSSSNVKHNDCNKKEKCSDELEYNLDKYITKSVKEFRKFLTEIYNQEI
jgi:hypothetical protein